MISLEQQNELSQLISDTYGTSEAFTQHLELCLEMLFYLEEDTFSRVEIQEVATALRRVVRVLRG
ncbi:hypothetical protein Murru_2356 [Allomuricauda ruestringensis DSM 13258]|uniref:Uncharacterized protein n=1 Tax=Allomuricauda ruestringensis (strain DSM 13258 / CIP 107369 / LMG 19739 / B1) TaxID=886377 RepID=G2PP09_ALLRU|nr:hypothetical protein [Allomuricauda ruestringensis]AEM71394.1 hypothetical protein Murru_2356 [Allomuricauda ruestringensis DSM 13258]